MAEATKSCDFCPFLKMQEFEAASDIQVKVDVTKGSLISESILLWLKSPKNGGKTQTWAYFLTWIVLTAKGCDLAPFFGDLSWSKKTFWD